MSVVLVDPRPRRGSPRAAIASPSCMPAASSSRAPVADAAARAARSPIPAACSSPFRSPVMRGGRCARSPARRRRRQRSAGRLQLSRRAAAMPTDGLHGAPSRADRSRARSPVDLPPPSAGGGGGRAAMTRAAERPLLEVDRPEQALRRCGVPSWTSRSGAPGAVLRALENVSFGGSVVARRSAWWAKSGCGKSTLGAVFVRLHEQPAAEASVSMAMTYWRCRAGADRRRYHRRVQMAFQDPL